MKDEFETNVLARMMGTLTQEQSQDLKTALYIELQQYELKSISGSKYCEQKN